MASPSLIKRFLACIYELLILLALWMLGTWLYLQWVGPAQVGIARLGLQFSLWTLTGAYFVHCWVKSGQTPATQAWKFQLVNADGRLLNVQEAIKRYLLASLFAGLFGVGFVWALVDKHRLFLHDRLLGTSWQIKT